MNRIWIKLYLEILDDPKMGQLSDHLWRRSVELFLLAGKNGNDGKLPTAGEIAWTLRTSADEVTECLKALSKYGIVHENGGSWFVSHFEKRQYSESYERVKRYRNAKSNGGSNADEAGLSSSSSSSTLNSSLDSLGGGVGEDATWIPETPKQAKEHPYIQVYEKVCGRFPGERDYVQIIDTVHYLRAQHEDVEGYLMPYWTAWSSRKTKDQKPYSHKSLVWLCEWAMQGDIPKANGHEPQKGETGIDVGDVIRKVAKNGR